jgi:trimeric autotransporter adhesin
MRRNLFTLAALSLVCVLFLAACGTSSTPVLRYLTITPSSQTVAVGATFQYTAQGYYSNGNVQDVTSLVAWSSSNALVASVSGGLVTGVSLGTATISASASSVATVTATVTVNQLTSIAITPVNPTVAVGTTEQFDAMGTFTNPGGAAPTTSDITILANWSSSNANITIGTNTGLATVPATVTVGATSTINAALYGVTSNNSLLTVGAAVPVSLTVAPATPTIAVANTQAFSATENWSDNTTGHPLSAPVTWSSATPTTAGIVATTGVANGIAAGTSVITATETTTVTGNATLTVVAGTAHYAYVSNDGDSPSDIGSYTVTASASPYLTTLASFAVPSPSTQIVIAPNGQFMYYLDTIPNVNVATVAAGTGALATTATTYNVGSPTSFAFAAIDPFGRFLYVSNDVDSSIHVFTINADGSLSAGTTVTANLSDPQAVIVDKTGSYVYATNNTGSTISGYSINQTTGALTPLSTPTFNTGSGPFLMAMDPTGTYLYTANGTANSISSFSIAPATGLLTSLGADTTTTANTLFNVVVDPSGTHIYALDEGSGGNGQVFGFSIGTGGVIGSAIAGSPFATGNSPFGGIVIDPTGALMAVDNNGDGTISVYAITASTGVLTAGTAVPSGSGSTSEPLFVTFYNAP